MRERPTARVFLAFFLTYLVVSPGTVAGTDTNVRWAVTRRLWTAGALSLGPAGTESENLRRWGWQAQPGPDGQMYNQSGLGQPLAMLPWDMLGVGLSRLVPPSSAEAVQKLWMSSTFFPLVSALLAVAVHLLLLQLGVAERVALLTSLLAGLGTALLPYAQIHQEEPLVALCSVSSTLVLCRTERSISWSRALAVAALAGFGVVVRPTFLPGYALIGLFGLLWVRERGRPDLGRLATSFALIALALGAGLAAYNHLRFGSPWESGYGIYVRRSGEWRALDLPWSFLGPLFAPGKSVFLFSPAVLLGLWGLLLGPAKLRLVGALGCAQFLANTAAVGMTPWWGGDWCWGSRYQVHSLPLILVPAAAVLSQRLSGWRSAALALVVLASLLVQSMACVLRLDLEYMDGEPRGTHGWVITESQLYARAVHVRRLINGHAPLAAPNTQLSEEELRSLNSVNIFPFRAAAKLGWGSGALLLLAGWAGLLCASVLTWGWAWRSTPSVCPEQLQAPETDAAMAP